MKNVLSLIAFVMAACLMPPAASAQKVYRCGSAYSQTPCPEAVTVDAADERTRAQKSDAQRAAARDAKTALALEKTRLREEKEAVEARKAADKRAAAKKPDAYASASQDGGKRSHSKGKDPAYFTAKVPPDAK